MPELKVYTSEGKRVYSNARSSNDRIAEFFFGGVRLYIETKSRSEVELIVFFRASESEASRAEQYYAVYRTDTLRDLFTKFMTELQTKIEDEQEMVLQTTSEDTSVFNSLTRGQRTPEIPVEHEHIESLLREGNQLKIGVSSSTDAVGLVTKYLDSSAQRLAIADDIQIAELDDCDLLIELGGNETFRPLGSTKELLQEKNQNSISNIGSKSSTKSGNESKQLVQFIKNFVVVFIILLVLIIVIGTLIDIPLINAFGIENLLTSSRA